MRLSDRRLLLTDSEGGHSQGRVTDGFCYHAANGWTYDGYLQTVTKGMAVCARGVEFQLQRSTMWKIPLFRSCSGLWTNLATSIFQTHASQVLETKESNVSVVSSPTLDIHLINGSL